MGFQFFKTAREVRCLFDFLAFHAKKLSGCSSKQTVPGWEHIKRFAASGEQQMSVATF